MPTVHAKRPRRKPLDASERPFDLRNNVEQFECGHIRNVLELAEWDLQQAADMLGIHPETLKKKMNAYQLTPFELTQNRVLKGEKS